MQDIRHKTDNNVSYYKNNKTFYYKIKTTRKLSKQFSHRVLQKNQIKMTPGGYPFLPLTMINHGLTSFDSVQFTKKKDKKTQPLFLSLFVTVEY